LTFLVVVLGACLLPSSCGPLFNKNPVIVQFNVPDTVEANAEVALISSATDPDADSLSFSWSCSRGTFSDDSAPATYWYVAEVSGVDTVKLTVTDGRGGDASRAKTVVVVPLTFTIANWAGAVGARGLIYWSSVLPVGYRAYGSFSVDSSDINFLVLDEANFGKWQRAEAYRADVEMDRSTGASFADTAKVRTRYYFVLDNTYSVADKPVHIHVEGATP
jgi:hypothetical protein